MFAGGGEGAATTCVAKALVGQPRAGPSRVLLEKHDTGLDSLTGMRDIVPLALVEELCAMGVVEVCWRSGS